MTKNNSVSASNKKKIQKLADIVQELRQGKWFYITRLTSIKSLCQEQDLAFHFALYLSKLTQEEMRITENKHLSEERWETHKSLVTKAIAIMEVYSSNQGDDIKNELENILSQIRELQNEHKRQQWGPVRIIESSKTLLIEDALKCILNPDQSGIWCYEMAKSYTDRYNSSYGTGLMPESAPMLEDIVIFLKRYYGMDSANL